MRFIKTIAATLVLAASGFISLYAQNRAVSGKVLDAQQQPVIGASVVIAGTRQGTVTDPDGSFMMKVPQGDVTLEVACLGYVSVKANVSAGASSLVVTLEEDNMVLDETVVVGYGTQKKVNLTGAITSVDSKSFENRTAHSVSTMLQGSVPGLNISTSSGNPGSTGTLNVRGYTSINGAEPLVLIDGAVGDIDRVNPNDIESISVIKDAAAAAVYGARAANGVILVTTKKGSGNTRVSYNFTQGFSSPWREREVLNATEYAIMMNEGRINAGMQPLYADPYSYGEGTDWQKEVFNYNAPSQAHELSVSGASENVNYYLSLGYNSQDGIVGGNYGRSNYDRLSLRSNINTVLFDKSKERDWLNKATLGTNVSYAYITSTGVTTNSTWGSPLGSALALSPILKVHATPEEAEGYLGIADYVHIYDKDGSIFMLPGADYNEMVNPVASLSLPGSKGWSHKFVGNASFELNIWDNLKFRSSLGADLSFWGNDGYTPVYYLGTNNKATYSSASSESDRGLVWQLENILTYDKTLGNHSFSVLLGQSMKESSGYYLGGSARFLKDYDKPYLSYTSSVQENGDFSAWGAPNAKSKLASWFFRASYNYAERYMAQVTVRRDGSSRFGANNRWGTFPSFSLGWNIHNEPFITMPHWFNNAKLRFSWGQNGNDNIGDFRYTVLTSGNNNYIFGEGENVTLGTKASGLANPDLKWETSTQTNVGMDLGFFANSLTFTVDWFRKVTSGMLMEMNIPTYVGEAKPIGNVGIMNNSGVEMELGYKVSRGDWDFNVKGNLSYLKNRLIEYGNESGWSNLDSFQGTGAISRAENGMPFPFFYGYKTDGIFQNMDEVNSYVNANGELLMPNAVPGDVRFVDYNKDGKISDDDRTCIGDGTPDWTWGLNFNVAWKGFDLSMLWQGTLGNQVYDATRRNDISKTNLPSYMLNRWTGEGTSDRYPRFVLGDSVNWQSSDLMVYDGSYLRLKNIQLGYTLPEKLTKKAFISRLRVFVAAENLLTLTKYHGYDPEISSGGTSLGIDYGVYPQARTFSLGVNVAF